MRPFFTPISNPKRVLVLVRLAPRLDAIDMVLMM